MFGQFSAAERTSWWGGILAHGHGVRLGGAEITPVEPDLVRTGEGMSEMTISDALAERGTIPRVLSIAGTDPSGGAGTAADTKSIVADRFRSLLGSPRRPPRTHPKATRPLKISQEHPATQ